MPFGKYNGKPLESVPRGYLRWLVANVPLAEWLHEAVTRRIQGLPPAPPPPDLEDQVHEIVKEYDPAHPLTLLGGSEAAGSDRHPW